MNTIRLNQQNRSVSLTEITLESEVAFEIFDQCPADEREELVKRALHIGLLAVKEDRLSAFLARTESELGVQLEHLKLLFDLKKQIFFQTTQKGAVAEMQIAEALEQFVKEKGWRDVVALTGNEAGAIPRNKTGDIVCELDDREDRRLVIECKFNKQIALGEIEGCDAFGNRSDTAWSQLLEARANREGVISLIVFDRELLSSGIRRHVDLIGIEPGVGFIVVIDSRKGDYRGLFAAYGLARQIALAARSVALDDKVLNLIVRRLIQTLQETLSVRDLVEQNIENCREILRQLNRSLLLIKFCNEYLAEFLKSGNLSAQDLLAFYMGGDLRDRFKPIEEEIESLGEKHAARREAGEGLDDEGDANWGIKNPQLVPHSASTASAGKICAKCARLVAAELTYCPDCGGEL